MRWPDEWRGPYWEPRDTWIGVYWDRRRERRMNVSEGIQQTDVYVCLVPCFPIRLAWVSTYAVTFAHQPEWPTYLSRRSANKERAMPPYAVETTIWEQ